MTRISGYDPATGICWQFHNTGDRHPVYCKCPAHTGPHSLGAWFGRCRSGKRWFWAAAIFHESKIFGWENTEELATAAAMAAVLRLRSDDEPMVADFRQGCASLTLKDLNKTKRAARPAPDTSDAHVVEYLYGSAYYTSDYANESGLLFYRFRITKKTKKRIFYLRNSKEELDAHGEPSDFGTCAFGFLDDECIGYIDRQNLEATGEVWNDGVHWCRTDHHLYASFDRMLGDRNRAEDQEPDLKKLKAEMAAAHPDKGGSSAAFIKTRARYEDARRRRRA